MSRVRVILEGERRPQEGDGFVIGDGNDYPNFIYPSAAHVVSVEDIPDPEPEHWPPRQGDVWHLSGSTYVVGSDGWGNLVVGSFSSLTATKPVAAWKTWALEWRATYPRLVFALVFRAGKPVQR